MRTRRWARRPPPWATLAPADVPSVTPRDVGMSDVPATSIPLPTPAPAGTVDLGVLPEVNVTAKAPTPVTSDTTKPTSQGEAWQQPVQASQQQGIGQGQTTKGGGQWLRLIKLTVYGSPSPAAGGVASTSSP